VRFKRVFSLLAIISLSGLFACDFFPGSVYKMRQTMRTWSVMDAQSSPVCTLVGTYTFRYDVEVPDFNVTSILKLKPENRQDREFLPTQAYLGWDLNGSPFYQINYDLNNSGRGRTRLRDQPGWFFNADDEIDTWFCIQDGILPMHTKVDYGKRMRFHRESSQQSR